MMQNGVVESSGAPLWPEFQAPTFGGEGGGKAGKGGGRDEKFVKLVGASDIFEKNSRFFDFFIFQSHF